MKNLKTKHGLIFGFAVIALAAMFSFTLAGCDTDGGGTGGGGGATTTATVTGVTVTTAGDATSVAKGGTLQFSATVAGENSPAQTVTWIITTSGVASGTTISPAGLLTVAAEETKTSIEVKATSTVDTTKSGTKSVSVTASTTTATIKLAAGNEANTFTLTLTGATWEDGVSIFSWSDMVGYDSSAIFITGTKATSDGGTADSVSKLGATFMRTSDTVLTVKLAKSGSYTWKGTIKLDPDVSTAGVGNDAATYGTYGARFLNSFTKEGQMSGSKALGTLTVTADSATAVEIDTTN